MRNAYRLLLTVSAAALLSGCAGAWNGADQALTVAERHPISVDSQTVALTLDIAASRDGLTAMDKARLRAFADSYLNAGHGLLSISAPSGTSDDRGGRSLAAQTRDYLMQVGVDGASIADGDYRAADDRGGQLVLSYTHYVATPSACGVATGVKESEWRNLATPNFGCATQNNLAALVADPHDLVAPADDVSADAMARIRGVEKYRQGEKTESKTGDIKAKVAQQ